MKKVNPLLTMKKKTGSGIERLKTRIWILRNPDPDLNHTKIGYGFKPLKKNPDPVLTIETYGSEFNPYKNWI